MLTSVEDWLNLFSLSSWPQEAPLSKWEPKNIECIRLYEDSRRARWRKLEEAGIQRSKEDWERPCQDFWSNSEVPHYATPENVETHVELVVWRHLTDRIGRERRPGWERRLELAEVVLDQLRNGTSSGVQGPGLLPIRMPNFLRTLKWTLQEFLMHY